jgi:hypothetical protein
VCAAEKAAPPAAEKKPITTLTPASLKLLDAPAPPVREAAQTSAADDGRTFFRTRKGAVALVLIGAGIGAAWYAHKDSRDKVKSPIR